MKFRLKTAIFISVILISGCRKQNVIENTACNDLTTIDNWTTIDFKTDYTIQVPSNYKGLGMIGFEGNTFNKSSNDGTIVLDYGYCNGLFCFDFGDTIKTELPACLQVKDELYNLLVLDKVERFCQDSKTIGVLYFTFDTIRYKNLYWNSRLYWEDKGLFKQAMQIKFSPSEIETVKEIIETIKAK